MAGTRPARDGTCCSPRSTPRPVASGWIEPRRPQPHLAGGSPCRPPRRMASPSFYALHADDAAAADRRPRVRRHRLPARGRGAHLRRRSRRRSGRRARSSATAATTWLPQPVPRPVRAGAGGPRHGRRGGAGRAGRRRARGRRCRGGHAGLGREVATEGPARVRAELRDAPPSRSSGSASLAPQAGDDGLLLLARVGRVDPTSLDAYRASGGYEALARALELGAPGGHRGGHGREARRSRRRGVPDRPQVGRGRGAARHAALRRVQRGRVRARARSRTG